MFFNIGKEIKDKILTGELSNFVNNTRTIQKSRAESAKDPSKKKGCC